MLDIQKKFLAKEPVLILAPLAGITDHPTRRLAQNNGADLTYVEMISATALNYRNKKTLEMLARHPDEKVLGVQVTGRNPEELKEAIATLDGMNFDTIDINMGCPVAKVVNAGCGSALIKNPELVFRIVSEARSVTAKPLSVKFRLGWDQRSRNFLEVASAIESAGADWLTIHGRTRCDDYSVPVDLQAIKMIKAQVKIPVIGNGNLFSYEDIKLMSDATGVDGFMISRGALGNPWIFSVLKKPDFSVSLDSWLNTLLTHLSWQKDAYGARHLGAVTMRKHLLWYLKGWPGVKKIRAELSLCSDLLEGMENIKNYAEELRKLNILERTQKHSDDLEQGRSFVFEPKFDMHRELDKDVFSEEILG